MKRHELEHVLRAAGAIARSDSFFVIGSQSILGSIPSPPPDLVKSEEVDLWPSDDPLKSDLIDGTIGEMSPFHTSFGYFAHGVGPETAQLPRDWKKRIVVLQNANTNGIQGLCLHPLDLAIAKILAGREKDLEYVKSMLEYRLIDELLLDRIVRTELRPDQMEIVIGVLSRISSRPD